MVNRFVLAGLGLALVAAVAAIVTARQPAGMGDLEVAFVPPTRTSLSPPTPDPVPRVPAAAEEIVPIAYTLTTTWEGAAGSRPPVVQHVTRARDRVHVLVNGGRHEWVFERNPVYQDRVSAWQVDHAAREIRAHQETDLRNSLHIRGWIDVLTMRFDLATLGSLRDTGERRQVAGATFHRFRSYQSREPGVVETWWSPEWLLPLELVTRESGAVTATARIHDLSRNIDVSLLSSPAQRFPAYAAVDLVDAGEHR